MNIYDRDSTYRKRFFARHKGLRGIFFCAYCGKPLNQNKAEVDHIVSVNLVREKFIVGFITRKIVRYLKNGINNDKNLVCACSRCNKRKGKKGGLWILRGFIGPFFWPLWWFAILPVLIIFLILYFSGVISCPALDYILSLFSWILNEIGNNITKGFETILKLIKEVF